MITVNPYVHGKHAGVLRPAGLVAVCLGLVLALAAPAWAAKDDLDLVSRGDGAAGAKGDGDSYSFWSISGDGRFVVFDSRARNLQPDDSDAVADVFVRDVEAGTTTLASRAGGADGAKGDGLSNEPGISGDGRFAAFASHAQNLHPDDGDATKDVFVRDLQTNTTTLVSRAGGADGVKGNGVSSQPAISADGRFVTFRSVASNLHPDDGDSEGDVFVRDLREKTTTLVSRADGVDGAGGNGISGEAATSVDGRSVVFTSSASNLDADDGDVTRDVFVRDLDANTTTLVSRADGVDGIKANGGSDWPTLSADGRLVVFNSSASNLHSDDGDGTKDVFVRDLQANTTTLVSRADGAVGAKGDHRSGYGVISADGRYVAFDSTAANLHPDDTDDNFDVFVRDLHENTTTLVSRAAGPAGVKGNDWSDVPTISADGRFVAFESGASNLHPDDGDDISDLYRRDVLGPPPTGQPAAGQPPAGQPPAGPPPAGQPPAASAVPSRPGCPLAGTVIVGTGDDDRRSGSAVTDIMLGRRGADILRGLAGADCLYGHKGADRLYGGHGRDRLFGGPGPDRVSGGASDDLIDPRSGRDLVAAGSGNDRVIARRRGVDTIDCGRGRDIAIVDNADRTRRCEQVRRP